MKTKLLFLFYLTLSMVTAQNTYEFDWGFSSTNQQISIDVGDTVTWTWTGGTHNLRSLTGGAESFDSGYSGATGFTFSHTFTVVGQTDYVCDPHAQSMYGTVTVNAAAQSFSAGDIIVTEIMKDTNNDTPGQNGVNGVSDDYGEWFEVYNTTSSDIDLNGWTIRDQPGSSQNIANIDESVIVPAGSYITMGRGGNTDPTSLEYNGGVSHAFVYAFVFNMSNGADEVILEAPDGTIIDEVYYDNGATFPDDEGKSLSLDPGSLNATANDSGANWCASVDFYGTNNDLGTPGNSNPTCAPTCEASLAGHDATCDDITPGIDTYSVSLAYFGAGNSLFSVSTTAGTVGGDDPSTAVDGNILVTGVPEGTDIIITMDDTGSGGLCNLIRSVTSPVCEPTGSVDLVLQGIIDFKGSTGTNGKGLHLIATEDITDLSTYAVGVVSNGNGDVSADFTFPAGSTASAGDHILLARDVAYMDSYMDASNIFSQVFDAGGAMSQNGNDPIVLIKNSVVVENFQDPTLQTSSSDYTMSWAYRDSWVYKVDGDWTYGGIDCTSPATDTTWDSDCVYPFAIGQNPLSTPDLTINKISVFPNPVSNGIVNIKSQNLGDVNAKLYDIMGRCVLSTKINSETLNVSSVGPGVYLLQVSVGDSSNTTKLVIR